MIVQAGLPIQLNRDSSTKGSIVRLHSEISPSDDDSIPNFASKVNLVWETMNLTYYLLYLVTIPHTKSSQDVLEPTF